MVGYIIGIILGVIIFLLQNFKPTSIGFRIAFFILTIAFIWGISYAQLGYWNILVIPLGIMVLCFIAALCFPYGGNSAKNEYMYINNQWELIGSTTDDFDPIDLETIDNYFRE